ncbi:MAG TPA: serine/threonine-protein kinase [Polyangiaceae bacterium]|nr:serine/threonine-protein kinase [Polyangiaceae bacterium]
MRRASRLAAETVEGSEPPAPRAAISQEPNAYLSGEVIADRYRLERELGRGGMGVVWLAHSLVLGVDVAVKLIRASASGPGVASRMAREAHAAARLGHPALVRVFDFGWTSRSDPFLVMELVLGETLAALLEREARLPAIRAVQMLLPIADGLRLAHDRGIVHRDIKPENIFLASDPLGRAQPKLLDFGIAKVGEKGVDGKLTQVGAVLGSPEYMSPEQALGSEEIDGRTDVWSLCIVLYEMVTGTIPFRKPNYNALMQSIINDTPRPASEYGTADASLWLVIERGLAKSPADRWANMTELGEALALWLYEHGIKEDLSGNSIRAVWLDGLLSGVRVDVAGSVPPIPEGAAPLRERGTAAARANVTTPLEIPAKKRRPSRLALGVAAGALAGALATALVLRSFGQTEPRPAPSAEARNRAAVALATAVAQPAPSPAPARAQPVEEPRASASASTKPRPARPPTARPSAVRRPPEKRSHDFGF